MSNQLDHMLGSAVVRTSDALHTDSIGKGPWNLARGVVAIVFIVSIAGCGGGGGSGGGTPSLPPISLQFSADSSIVTPGQAVKLTWISTATTCNAAGDWSGDQGVGGTTSFTVNQNVVLTLNCSSGNSTVSGSLRIEAVGTTNKATSTLAYSANGSSTLSYVILPIDSAGQVYDAESGLIHAFTSATSASYPQSLISIDPASAEVVASTPLSAVPWTMAASADGQYLYVMYGTQGTPIQRWEVTGLVADLSIPLDGTEIGQGIAVSPLSSTTVAVTAKVATDFPQSELKIIDGTTTRLNTYLTPSQVTLLGPVWTADGSAIVVPGDGINEFSVDAQGVTPTGVAPSGGAYDGRLHGSLFYDDDGSVIDLHGPVTLQGRMADGGRGYAARVENTAINKSFALDEDEFENQYLTAYSTTQYNAIDSIQIPLANGLSGPGGGNVLLWGSNGVAWSEGGSLIIAQGSFMQSGGAVAPISSLPTIAAGNLLSQQSSSMSYSIFDVHANDIAADGCGHLYIAISGSASFFANSVVTFDPLSGAVSASNFAASEPSVLAAAADCTAIYAGSQDTNSIAPLSLPSLTPAAVIPLVQSPPPTGISHGLPFAQSIAVAPSNAGTIAVTLNFQGALCNSAEYGLALFDGVTRRPSVFVGTSVGGPRTAVWGADNSTVYEEDWDGVNSLAVSASGASQPALLIPYASLEGDTDIYGLYANVTFDPGKSRVLTGEGRVYDLAAKTLTTLPVQPVINENGCGLWGAIASAPSSGKVFYAEYEITQNGNSLVVLSFDSETLQKIDQVTVPGPAAGELNGPIRLVRAANSNTVALVTSGGYVVSLSGPMFAP